MLLICMINRYFHDMQQRKSQGKIVKVKCRICKTELLAQNYRNHLKQFHPSEDVSDLRPYRAYNQSSLGSLFKLKSCLSSSSTDLMEVDDLETTS